ncbi:hypothetical protein ARAM_002579 [Aspergillus rambellii]|uniref:Mediator of RNA polymerase II transcription subunit 20 n=1 Tax=Aspergillus rambellii TaxID=308745 RepID=A0A0F8XGH9_9EURO|nr:hypothetical protein ARAM_002579 [Aspergillus rambellii]
MPITGVFFIPSNPNASTVLSTVSERLHSVLAEEPTHVGRWALEHKLMRDTPSCLPPSTTQRPLVPKYMQFLSLTSYPNHGFIYTSQPLETQTHLHHPAMPVAAAPPNSAAAAAGGTQPGTASSMVMTTVPLPSCSALYQHFVYACQPFWCPRHTVAVGGGMVYDVGDFRVRLGDVRQTQPAARVRGTVVEIEWRGPSLVNTISSLYQSHSRKGRKNAEGSATDRTAQLLPHHDIKDGDNDDNDSGIDLAFPEGIDDADIDGEYAASAVLIREFWARLGIEGAREAILVPGLGKEVKEQLHRLKQQEKQPVERGWNDGGSGQVDEDPDPTAGVDVARQFMEIFRFNR